MSETKFKTESVKKEETTSIEADTVILNLQKAALDLDTLIDRHVRHKYPDKYIAKPSQEEARMGIHKGWKLLKYLPERQEFLEVKSMDDATTTKGNVYAWRDKRIQAYIDEQERSVRDINNRKVNADSTKTQADGLTNTLASISGGKIKAQPLDEGE